eukprot:GILJ01001013.1.p1 GENE.GILJ01001013.1~~GILJ01001013.1.p1  ORF type:complete len:196 (-),score=10.71 GILJ01001013.1:85-627(-)
MELLRRGVQGLLQVRSSCRLTVSTFASKAQANATTTTEVASGRNTMAVKRRFGPRRTADSDKKNYTPAEEAIKQFMESTPKGERITAGRSWKAAELRLKSFDDLHKLWYVLLKERNMLLSEKLVAKSEQRKMINPERLQKVRKSMARIKFVTHERVRLEREAFLQRGEGPEPQSPPAVLL